MKCKQCEAIFGSNYKVCPSCGGKEIELEKFAPQLEDEVDEVEPITPYAVDGDIDDMGSM